MPSTSILTNKWKILRNLHQNGGSKKRLIWNFSPETNVTSTGNLFEWYHSRAYILQSPQSLIPTSSLFFVLDHPPPEWYIIRVGIAYGIVSSIGLSLALQWPMTYTTTLYANMSCNACSYSRKHHS